MGDREAIVAACFGEGHRKVVRVLDRFGKGFFPQSWQKIVKPLELDDGFRWYRVSARTS